MATTGFRPYAVEENEYVGTILRVRAIRATVPDDLLPARVRLSASWVRRGGAALRKWHAEHDGGMISLPVVPGDGSQDLEQLIDWLEARGYRSDSADDDPDAFYVRTRPEEAAR